MPAMEPSRHDDELDRLLRRSGPMNLERAYQVMAQFDLEGLVLGDPLNVFHALGYFPHIALTRAGQPPSSFALLSRRPGSAPGFVTTRFIHYYTFADGRFERELQTWLYEEAGDGSDESPVADWDMFPDRGLAPLTEVEARRRAALDSVPLERRTVRDAGAALVRAMQGMGLWQGRVAFDHPVIAAVCERHGHPGTLVAGDNILRAIRIVKSPLEILLMRRASAANIAAVHAVIDQLRAGASYADVRRAFDVEAARRGNRAVFLTVDRVSSELSDERVRDGQTLFIDGVSHFRRYHGDYARTVFVGEPVAAAKRAAAAMSHGWQAVREQLRPGLRYSEITRLGRAALRQGGFDAAIGFGPHSVGLAHTDEPCDDAGGFYRKSDLVLQENMILSVDCPVLATGIGGSAHMEDLMLITARGAEPIHELSDAVVQV
jgi:Xaa-Pro aminopeptidase